MYDLTGSRRLSPGSSSGLACGRGSFPTPERIPPPSLLSEFLQPQSLLLLELPGGAPKYYREEKREGEREREGAEGREDIPKAHSLPVCFISPNLPPETWEVNIISVLQVGTTRIREVKGIAQRYRCRKWSQRSFHPVIQQILIVLLRSKGSWTPGPESFHSQARKAWQWGSL